MPKQINNRYFPIAKKYFKLLQKSLLKEFLKRKLNKQTFIINSLSTNKNNSLKM